MTRKRKPPKGHRVPPPALPESIKSAERPSTDINRRKLLKAGLYGTLAVGVGGGLWYGLSRNRRPSARTNVIVIVVDTLRADHLGCHGYRRDITPNIDALARDGLHFRNAISAAPWTLPSVASLLTSQYPSVLGVRDRINRIDDRFSPLAELLRQNGYATHGIVSVDMLSGSLGLSRGFDTYDESNYFGRQGITSPTVFQKAITYLRRQHEKPFFLFVHTFDPHYNYILHDEFDFFPTYKGQLTSNYPIEELWGKLSELTEEDVAYLVALYDSEIAFTDRHFGRLLANLQELGRYEDSIIIFTADHGEEFMERGWVGHSITLHQEQIHVPLIIKLPGCRARVIDTPVGLIDIMPTLLRYLEIEPPVALEGEAYDLTSQAVLPARPIFSETFHSQVQRPGPLQPVGFGSVILQDHKLIYNAIDNSRQVYDLATDPGERNNRAAVNDKYHRTLATLFSRWVAHLEAKQRLGPTPDESELLTPEQIEHLKALGYL